MNVRPASDLSRMHLAEFRPYLKLLRKNAWLILICAATGFIIGQLITHRQLDVHSATAEILLRQDEGADTRLRMLGELNGRRATDDVQNQLRILKSYDLVGRAVDRLNEPLDCFFVGRIRTTQVPGFGNLSIHAIPGLFHPTMLGRDIDLFVEDAEHFRLHYTNGQGEGVNEVYRFGVPIEGPDLAMTVRYIDSADRISAAQKQHFRIRVYNRDGRIAQFRSGLTVENVERTSILTLHATSTLPGRAKEFLDTLAAAYISYTQDVQLESGLQTEQFIDRRISDLATIIDSLERESNRYRTTQNVLDLDREQSDQFDALVRLETQERALEMRLDAAQEMLNFLTTRNADDAIPPGRMLVNDDPMIAQLVTRISTLRTDRAAALIDVTPENYHVRRIDSSIRITRFNLVRYLEDSRRSMQSELRGLASEMSKLEQRLGNIPNARKDLLAIERNLKVNEDLYVFLLEAKANTYIERAGVAPSASVVEQARIGGIVGPNKRRTMLISTGIGLLIACAIAATRLLLFTRIETLEELREATDLQQLGGIPHYDDISTQPIAILADPRSQVTEAFRGLRTSLHYALKRDGARSFLVSSLHPGEGKSFVSSNLAVLLAKSGKRVALLDFDLHKPRIHSYLNLSNRVGLSMYLSESIELADIVQKGPLPALDVYTAGPVPPNASELLLNERLKDVLDELKSTHDYIVLDSPPILLITDALVLLQHVDAGILVLNTERTSPQSLNKLETILSNNGIENTSVVLNNIRMSRFQRMVTKYAHKYGYGYGYGYSGYTYGDSKTAES